MIKEDVTAAEKLMKFFFLATENVTVGSLLSVRNTSCLFDELKFEIAAGLQISLLKCWLRLKKITFSFCKC